MVNRKTRKRKRTKRHLSKLKRGGALIDNISHIINYELGNTTIWEHIGNLPNYTVLLYKYKALQTSVNNVKSFTSADPKNRILHDSILEEYHNIVKLVVDIAAYLPGKYQSILRNLVHSILQSHELRSYTHIIQQLSKKAVRTKLQDILDTSAQLNKYFDHSVGNLYINICDLGKEVLDHSLFDSLEVLDRQSIHMTPNIAHNYTLKRPTRAWHEGWFS